MAEESSNTYLGYLDKEMTIMGILSTFCALVSGGVIQCITANKDNAFFQDVWEKGEPYILAGSALILFAALLFYLQRSSLAWYYGQISLCVAAEKKEDLKDWYRRADSWATWIRYRIGFALMSLGFAYYGFGLLTKNFSHLVSERNYFLSIPAGILFVIYSLYCYSLWKYRYNEKPFRAFLKRQSPEP